MRVLAREKAHIEGTVPRMTSCAARVEDNKVYNSVRMVARMLGYLDVIPSPTGLVQPHGPFWDALPVGHSRLASCVLRQRREELPCIAESTDVLPKVFCPRSLTGPSSLP